MVNPLRPSFDVISALLCLLTESTAPPQGSAFETLLDPLITSIVQLRGSVMPAGLPPVGDVHGAGLVALLACENLNEVLIPTVHTRLFLCFL